MSFIPREPFSQKRTGTYVVFALFVVLLVVGACYFWRAQSEMKQAQSYRAVFLTNGQVYFGHIIHQNTERLDLQDVYYLQMKQPLQDQQAQIANQPDLALIKLGKELHGPTDQMQIMTRNVLFVEELSSTSKVLKAIQDYTAK